jgi:hypothetical protein
MCSLDFYKTVGVLTNQNQYVQEHFHYQEETFDFNLFCSFVKEINGLESSLVCRDGDSDLLAIFDFLIRQDGCDYDRDIITNGKCDTYRIDHAMYSEDKSLICEVCDRLRNLETTRQYLPPAQRKNQTLASDAQKLSKKAAFESFDHLIRSESMAGYLNSTTSNLELSYSIVYHPRCERTIDEIIQSYCECDLHPESHLNTTYEAIKHELLQFDTCLFNAPKGSLCAMATTKFIITSNDAVSEEWNLKYKFNKLIKSIDFLHSLHSCSIKTC